MCECYQIGGPFIDVDPDCPTHGAEAQIARTEREQADRNRDERIATLEQQVEKLQRQVRDLLRYNRLL